MIGLALRGGDVDGIRAWLLVAWVNAPLVAPWSAWAAARWMRCGTTSWGPVVAVAACAFVLSLPLSWLGVAMFGVPFLVALSLPGPLCLMLRLVPPSFDARVPAVFLLTLACVPATLGAQWVFTAVASDLLVVPDVVAAAQLGLGSAACALPAVAVSRRVAARQATDAG